MSSGRQVTTRFPRAWARLGLATAAATGVVALALAVLVERDAQEPAPRTHAPAPAPAATEPAPVTTSAPAAPRREPRVRPAPRSVKDVLRQDAQLTAAELEAWLLDERLEPQVRYAALRRLEQQAPGAAVAAALALLDDPTPLLRLNAIAVLSRSQDPEARAALERLDDRSRRLAEQLARR